MSFKLSYQINSVNWNGSKITTGNEDEFLARLDVFQKCGISEVMLSGYTDVEEADFDMLKETARIGNILRSRGMKAAQHHGLAPIYAPLTGSQSAVREKLKRSVQYTANLNADVLLIHPGRIDAHFNTSTEYIAEYEKTVNAHGLGNLIDACAENLHEAGEYAESLGVKIALENVDRFEPMGTIRILPDLIEKANSSTVGFCLDSGHAHCCGEASVMDWIKRLGSKLITTHFHDNRGPRNVTPGTSWIVPHGIDEHLPPGFGTIPWIDVIQGLWDADYKYTVNFESSHWPGFDPEEGYRHAIAYWRTLELLAEQKR